MGSQQHDGIETKATLPEPVQTKTFTTSKLAEVMEMYAKDGRAPDEPVYLRLGPYEYPISEIYEDGKLCVLVADELGKCPASRLEPLETVGFTVAPKQSCAPGGCACEPGEGKD